MDEARGDARVRWNHLRGNSPSLVGVHRLADYGWVAPLLRKGEPVVVVDAECTPQIPESDRQAMADMRIAAAVYAPLIKNGKLVGALSVADTEPRTWSNAQVSLVEEVAERTWEAVERARTETALRESEERQAFLLKLADALRPLSDPVGVQQVVVRMLAGQLDVDRCYYAEFDWPRDVLTINTNSFGHLHSPSLASTRSARFKTSCSSATRASRSSATTSRHTRSSRPRWLPIASAAPMGSS
jgi:GAF domain-containing protein